MLIPYLVKGGPGFPVYYLNVSNMRLDENDQPQIDFADPEEHRRAIIQALLLKESLLTKAECIALRTLTGVPLADMDGNHVRHLSYYEPDELADSDTDRYYRRMAALKYEGCDAEIYRAREAHANKKLVLRADSPFIYHWQSKPFDLYTDPGGYDIGYLCDDGGMICAICANKEIDQTTDPHSAGTGWLVVAAEGTQNMEEGFICDNCGEEYNAYGASFTYPEGNYANE